MILVGLICPQVNDNNIQNFRTNQQVELVIEVGQSGHDFTERIPVDVTKQSGYLFIQTDRPIYRYLPYGGENRVQKFERVYMQNTTRIKLQNFLRFRLYPFDILACDQITYFFIRPTYFIIFFSFF